MKKFNPVIPAVMLFTINITAQDIDKIKTSFEYIRLPMTPLNKDIKNYTGKIILGYVEKVSSDKMDAEKNYAAELESYEKKDAEAEEKYKLDMIQYEKDKADAEAKHNKELEEYNQKSTGKKISEKLFLEEKKPKLYLPSKPYKNSPKRPVKVNPESVKLQKMFNTDALASSYLKLDGYKNSTDNAVNIIVTMAGFENIDPEVKTRETSSYQTESKSTVKQTMYSYSVSYKLPMNLRLESAKGVVFDEYIESFNIYSSAKTTEFKTQYDLEQWWKTNKDPWMGNLVEKAALDNLKYIDSLLNSSYGYSKTKHETDIRLVKDKKVNYDDYQQAYENVTSGYNLLAESNDRTSALPQIQKAIEIWEAALKESNPDDKKARIDADVTMATIFNLAEACIWTNDFTRASSLLAKLNSMDPSKKEKREAGEISEFLKLQKLRDEANK